MSNPTQYAFPNACTPGLTKLEYFAGLRWSQEDIDSVIGKSVGECSAFIGIDATEYKCAKHYHIAIAKARVTLAKALIAELEMEQP